MADILPNQGLATFLDSLASQTPSPGGGSVAALSGAMAAGLVSMVCAITLNKEISTGENGEVRLIWEQSEEIRHELQHLIEADADVFQRLSAVYKLPRTTDADAASRRAAIQRVTREATDIPLHTARTAARLISLCTALVNRCSRMLASDVGIAVTLARAAIQSSFLNIEINLSRLEDQNYVRQVRMQMEDLTIGLAEETSGVLEIVRSRINQ